jgi:uncharacterized protein involved in outer membrane biogenesis
MKLRWVAGGVVVVAVVSIAIAAAVLLDEERLRSELESGLSEALQMEVYVPGRVSLGLFPALNITGEQARFEKDGVPVADLEVFRMNLRIAPLFRGEVEPRHVDITGANLEITRLESGRFNFQDPDPEERPPEEEVPSAEFRSSSLRFFDEASEIEFLASGCQGRLPKQVAQEPGSDRSALARFEAPIEIQCEAARSEDFDLSHVELRARIEEGVFLLDLPRLAMLGGEGRATVEVERPGDTAYWHFELELEEFLVEAFLQTLGEAAHAEGTMNFSATLWAAGNDRESIERTLEGDLSADGRILELRGVDLDQRLGDYKSTQEFSLLDAVAVLFAGPAGLLVTKGLEYAALLDENGGSTRIREVVAQWKVEGGVASAQDVAMATAEHRLAASGKINFAERSFDDFVVAVLDREGCALMEQRVRGSLDEPEIEQPGLVETLVGPIVDLVESGIEALTGEGCDAFYTGAVAAREQQGEREPKQ